MWLLDTAVACVHCGACAVHDADVPAECGLDGHHQFRGIVHRHPRHAELRLQRGGVRAALPVHRHGVGLLSQPQPIR